MKIKQFLLVIVYLVLCFGGICQSVTDTNTYHLEMKNGNIFFGKLINQDSSQILFKSFSLGEIKVDRSQIKEIYTVDVHDQKHGQFWLRNPQSSRYFFSPNGFGLKKGEAYYQNVWVLVNSFVFGINKHFSVGAGVVPLFLFSGGSTPIWLTAKFSLPFEKENFALGGGLLAGTVAGEDNLSFGITYGIGTIGNENNNISIGLGYGYAAGSWAKKPMINLNFMVRLGPRAYMISENYFIQIAESPITILSLGGRHIIKKAGLDYGLVFPINEGIGSFIAIPWLGITIPFTIQK